MFDEANSTNKGGMIRSDETRENMVVCLVYIRYMKSSDEFKRKKSPKIPYSTQTHDASHSLSKIRYDSDFFLNGVLRKYNCIMKLMQAGFDIFNTL